MTGSAPATVIGLSSAGCRPIPLDRTADWNDFGRARADTIVPASKASANWDCEEGAQ